MSGRERSNTHQRLAYEAARIMLDQGVREFDRARRKAAERVGIADKRLWPDNSEIHEALLQQQRLFQGEDQERELRRLYGQALEAMRVLSEFVPRLVAPVLAGGADPCQGVCLHLFTDTPEAIIHALLDRGIPWQEGEKFLRYGDGARRAYPAFRFLAGETPFELVALPLAAQRNRPVDPVTERPEPGARVAEVARLLDGWPEC